jgi:thiamine-phosphate pyrophosphorylase
VFDPPLYLITDRRRFPEPARAGSFHEAEWRALAAALAAGVGALQLREKDLDGRPLYERALALLALARERRVALLVNDRADVARAAGADGVHLPEAGLPVADARALVGPDKRIGCSVHSLEGIARTSGADFVVFGPVFDTPSKRAYGPPQGLARLEEVSAASALPVFAIGGVTAARVADVVASGAAGVAVVGTVLDDPAPAERVRELARALSRAGAA